MKFTIYTFGCKVNNYESNMMKEKMLHHNFSFVSNFDEADIIIINTCTVTNTADNKCLKLVRRIIKNYPTKIKVVVGCSVQNNILTYENLDIDILLGNENKSKIASLIEEYIKSGKKVKMTMEKRDIAFEDMVINSYDKARAFIKIEDGCDNFCSYCIIPYVRGSIRCKDYDLILEEARCLAKKHHEIILTGIHTGHYQNKGKDLSDLISDLSKIEDLKRIRVSSIEVTEITDKFLNVLKTCPKLVDHLHIPLQAGSDKILKLMNRKYDVTYFKEKIASIRKIRPNISITTDIIVGFPNETEADFNETLKVSNEIKFSKIHVFPFSPRKGTVASKMDNVVSDTEKKRRVKELINLSTKLEREYQNKFKGQSLDVLIEKVNNHKSYGHTGNYLEVELAEELEIGKIYQRIL